MIIDIELILMMRILFVFLTLILFKSNILSQNNQSSIHLRAVSSVSEEEYFIDILPNKDSTKLIFRIKKSVKQSKLDKDTNIIRIIETVKSVKKFGFNNDTVKTNLAKLDSLYRIYTIYETDSLFISNSKNEAYLELVHEVLNTSAEILENKNNNRYVLDGVTMRFILTNNGNSQNVYVRSPTLTSNPLLYKLVTETTALFRLNKKNNFLNKTRTSGY
jgi:hypothetical protein